MVPYGVDTDPLIISVKLIPHNWIWILMTNHCVRIIRQLDGGDDLRSV